MLPPTTWAAGAKEEVKSKSRRLKRRSDASAHYVGGWSKRRSEKQKSKILKEKKIFDVLLLQSSFAIFDFWNL
jgi:hypothetical protein